MSDSYWYYKEPGVWFPTHINKVLSIDNLNTVEYKDNMVLETLAASLRLCSYSIDEYRELSSDLDDNGKYICNIDKAVKNNIIRTPNYLTNEYILNMDENIYNKTSACKTFGSKRIFIDKIKDPHIRYKMLMSVK